MTITIGGLNRSILATLYAGALVVLAAPTIASAQATPASPTQSATSGEPVETKSKGTKESAKIEEVVVTARYKTEDIQDVPLSITALDSQTLLNMGAQQLSQYASTIPGLSFTDRGPNRNNIVLRGISPFTGTSAVGIYLDGVEQSNLDNNPDFGLWDIGRIEVLRGPQGTLYGEGSLGGTIRVFTNEPSFAGYETNAEVSGSATDSGSPSGAVNAVTNVPLSSLAALRISGYYRHDGGWIDNVADGVNDLNWHHATGARGAFRIDPIENLDLQLIVNYQEDKIGMLNNQDPTLERSQISRLTDVGEQQHATQVTLLGTYKMQHGSLQEVLGYNEEKDHRGVDSLSFIGVPAFNLYYDAHGKIFSNETRYVSDLAGRFNFVLGFYYKNINRDVALNLIDGGVLFGLPGDYLNDGTSKDRTTAVYGEMYYKLTEKLRATVGLRWSDDQISFPINTTIGPIVVASTDLSGSYTATTPKFGLDYTASPNVLYFVNVARGYRPGGVNPLPSDSPYYTQTYKPDWAWSYEAGVKSETADHRLRANLTAYYIDWKDLQILGEPTNASLGFTTNAGRAHSKGFEAEFTAALVRGLELDVGVGYADARLDEPAQGLPEGARIPGVSPWNASVGAQYEWPLAGRWSGFARADWWYHDKTDSAPPYDWLNLRFGAQSDRWGVFLFVNNVTNTQGITVSDTGGDQFVQRPREIGIDLRGRF